MVLFTSFSLFFPSPSVRPICPFPTVTPRASFASPHLLTLSFRGRKTSRCLTVVTRAGPTTSTYVSAFLLPLSLLAITIFTSMRIADKLDRDFLEEEVHFQLERSKMPIHVTLLASATIMAFLGLYPSVLLIKYLSLFTYPSYLVGLFSTDFFEQLAINQAIREEEETKEEDDGGVDIDPEKQVKQPSFPSRGIRNRPKRQV